MTGVPTRVAMLMASGHTHHTHMLPPPLHATDGTTCIAASHIFKQHRKVQEGGTVAQHARGKHCSRAPSTQASGLFPRAAHQTKTTIITLSTGHEGVRACLCGAVPTAGGGGRALTHTLTATGKHGGGPGRSAQQRPAKIAAASAKTAHARTNGKGENKRKRVGSRITGTSPSPAS